MLDLHFESGNQRIFRISYDVTGLIAELESNNKLQFCPLGAPNRIAEMAFRPEEIQDTVESNPLHSHPRSRHDQPAPRWFELGICRYAACCDRLRAWLNSLIISLL